MEGWGPEEGEPLDFKTKLLDSLRWATGTSQASLAISVVVGFPL